MTYAYLAVPFEHENPVIEQLRYECTTHAVGKLMGRKKGYPIFSPITHSYPIRSRGYLKHWEHKDFLKFDLTMLSSASKLYVLMLEGWTRSKGVTQELEFVKDNNIPIDYLVPSAWVPEYPLNYLTELHRELRDAA